MEICYLKLPQDQQKVAHVRGSGKFKILAFYKLLGKPNIVFTSFLASVSLKGNKRVKIDWHFKSDCYFISG